ncbi:ficolin-2-like [Saccostrea echinata]|uniref:ficolin-2-like n=1 Tax=Saccostrea echinata TaxID=191078 RepID=UPI002A80C565|nr:ficolin-2-like [Saccostrea echinata]
MTIVSITILSTALIFCECCDFNISPIHGERYISPVVAVVSAVGPQQCVRECLVRNTWCNGVNYNLSGFVCEIMTDINETELKSDFFRIERNQMTVQNVGCLSCFSLEKCVKLSSNKTCCVKDDFDPKDCTTIHEVLSHEPSGLYRIKIPALGHVIVFCEMEADGGGWTVFQRRMDGSEDFYRTWAEYRSGFGNLTAEFWLGNDKLYHLLSQGLYELRVDMSDFDNQTRYVKFSSISLGNEESKYTITLSGFSGNVGDSLTYINNRKFSTKDQDNDMSEGSCSVGYKGGWWYGNCHFTNPNGLYLGGVTSINAQGITYSQWLGQSYSLKHIQFMVRRVD